MIHSLNISNFKCFKDQGFNFGKMTILSGANGMGKSTVIQSLLLLRETHDRVNGLLSPTTEAKVSISLNGPYNLCLGTTQNITNAELESGRFAFDLKSDSKELQRYNFNVDIEIPRTTIEYQLGIAGHAFEQPFPKTSLFFDEFHYLVAERVGPRDLYGMSDQPFISTGFAGEYTAQAISQSAGLHVNKALCLASDTSLFRVQLEAWLDQITPGIQISTFDYPEVNRVRVGILRKGTGTNWLSPSNIGFGISYALPVIVSGLLAPKGSLFIVENPEAHLHPAAQSAMGKFLARVALSGVQVVIETHSENVVNGARLEAISSLASKDDVRFIFFSMPEQQPVPTITQITMDVKGELSEWPAGFFDQQTRDLANIYRTQRMAPRS
jgi:predicted ATPase